MTQRARHLCNYNLQEITGTSILRPVFFISYSLFVISSAENNIARYTNFHAENLEANIEKIPVQCKAHPIGFVDAGAILPSC